MRAVLWGLVGCWAVALEDVHEEPFDWVGLYLLEQGSTYNWVAAKGEGTGYAANGTRAVVLELHTEEEEGLRHVEAAAAALMGRRCDFISPGASFPVANLTCTELAYDEAVYTSIFKLLIPPGDDHEEEEEEEEEDHHHDDVYEDDVVFPPPGAAHAHGAAHAMGYYAVFASNSPADFGASTFLRDSEGHAIDPFFAKEAGHSHDGHDDHGSSSSSSSSSQGASRRKRAWRLSLLASLLVVLCTGVGALLRLGFASCAPQLIRSPDFTKCTSALATGALLGCAVYLLEVESTHLIESRWRTETGVVWRFGTAVVAGYTLCFGLAVLLPHPHQHHLDEADGDCDEANEALCEAGACVAGTPTADPVIKGLPPPPPLSPKDEPPLVVAAAITATAVAALREVDWALVLAITLGDFAHNFVDGIFIAYAFLECKVSRGWVVAGTSVYHELAQEVSDFFLLVNKGGLSPTAALLVNLVSGLSIFVGVVTFMLAKPGSGTQGIMLAFGAGVYLHIALTEAASDILSDRRTHKNQHRQTLKSKLVILFFYALGVVSIGLSLLDHAHCEADLPVGDASGHNH